MLIILMCDIIFHFLWLQKHILWYGRQKWCIFGQSVILLKTSEMPRAPLPFRTMSEVFQLCSLFAAVVSHIEQISKWLRRDTIKYWGRVSDNLWYTNRCVFTIRFIHIFFKPKTGKLSIMGESFCAMQGCSYPFIYCHKYPIS